MRRILIPIILLINSLALIAEEPWKDFIPEPDTNAFPKKYFCPKVDNSPVIDGIIKDSEWVKSEWTDKFVDIEGKKAKTPTYRTTVKMCWDNDYFYFAAMMEEPHIWAKLEERDSVIFYDNDFEIFIDPDGDTKNYYEFEMNALNTVWDLLLVNAYRDGSPSAIDSWDIQGLKTAVHIDGSINDPSDKDKGWSVEVAIPWKVLEECSQGAPPKHGDVWRVNFSRVEWDTDIANGEYIKKNAPEHNWVWSPQGIINMHYPELWGYVIFREDDKKELPENFVMLEKIKWQLRRLYYKEYTYFLKNGEYTDIPKDMGLDVSREFPPPYIFITPNWYEARIIHKGYFVSIQADGKVWVEKKQ